MRSDGKFQLAAAEQAAMKQAEDPVYYDSCRLEGRFEEIENGRVTFWVAANQDGTCFAQFMGVITGETLELDFPYKSSSKGPWSLKGHNFTKELREVPEGEWRRWQI